MGGSDAHLTEYAVDFGGVALACPTSTEEREVGRIVDPVRVRKAGRAEDPTSMSFFRTLP